MSVRITYIFKGINFTIGALRFVSRTIPYSEGYDAPHLAARLIPMIQETKF